jgi:hypothetical protein
MNHEEATQDAVAERYLIGELSADEAGAFEEHYFSCRDCADNVRTTAAFLANTRAVFEDRRDAEQVEARKPERSARSWKSFFAWPSLIPAGAFACATLYLGAVRIPQIERQYEYADTMTSVDSAVLRAETRGDETRVDVPNDQRVLVLELDVNPPTPLPSYSVELRGPADRSVYALRVKAPPPGESLRLLVPAKPLSSGSYTLIVAADPKTPEGWSSSYRFALNKQRGAN